MARIRRRDQRSGHRAPAILPRLALVQKVQGDNDGVVSILLFEVTLRVTTTQVPNVVVVVLLPSSG